MSVSRTLNRATTAGALCAMLLATTAACKRGPDGEPPRGTGPAPVAGQPQSKPGSPPPPPALTSDPVVWLEEQGAQLARSTALQAAPLPWREVTPTQGDAMAAPVRQWLQPALVIGQRQLFAGGEVLGPVACAAELPEQCSPAAMAAPTAKQLLHVPAGDLDPQGRWLTVLSAAQAKGWAGKSVWLLADRRIAAGAVLAAERALRQAGAVPQLGVATLDGHLAALIPARGQPAAAVELSFPASQAQVPAAELPLGAAPTDLVAIRVQVRRGGVHLILSRPAPAAAVTPELLGSVAEALNMWAEKARRAAPQITLASVEVSADAPWEEVVRVVDALRDTCARAPKGTPCRDQRPLYETVMIAEEVSPSAR